MISILLLCVGLGLLVAGSELLIKGASNLAFRLGISPLVIGLTVVAFGTSSPELAVSIHAAAANQAGIAVGNVVGSNIFNVLLILGIAALIRPLVVSQQLVKFDVPIMISISIIFLILGMDGLLSRSNDSILFSGLLLYIGFLIYLSKRERASIQAEYEQSFGSINQPKPYAHIINILLVISGLALLVLGAEWLVKGAVEIARFLGISERIIGLTIVAAGTSLPELVTSITASFRGKIDIAVGNVVGSNLFNLMGVLGLSSIIAPNGIEVSQAAINFDIPVMIAVACACLPIFFTGNLISRWEGAVFFAYYVAYTSYLVLTITHPKVLPLFNAALVYFVLPLTALTISLVVWRAWQDKKSA